MHQLHFHHSFPEVGCALSKHPVSCQHSATGVVSGESLEGGWGGGGFCDTRQVDHSLPISCSQLVHLSGKLPVKCNAQTLSVIGYEYPVTSGW